MDWNWFFSALAQSVAAIVGLMGAFIFTKIVTEKNNYEVNCNKINDLLLKSKELKEQAKLIGFNYYNKYYYDLSKYFIACKILSTSTTGGTLNTSLEYYEDQEFSVYDNKDRIIQELDEIIDRYKQSPPTTDRDIRDFDINIHYRDSGKMKCDNIIEQIHEYKYRINNNIEHISNFLTTIILKKKSFGFMKFIIWTLYSLFIFGILIPMSIMPKSIVDNNILINLRTLFFFPYSGMQLIKLIILFLVLIIFSIIIIYFFLQLNKLKYNKESVEILKKYTGIEGYSIYFANEIKNKKSQDL